MAQNQPQPIVINRFFTGLYEHRSPLMTPFTFVGLAMVERKDALIDGLNAELTDLFTLRRRYGFSQFCSSPLSGGEVARYFYTFKDLTGTLHLLGDLTQHVSILTSSSKTNLFTESANTAPRCTMQYVANTCYFANGVDLKKWLINPGWTATTVETVGTLITDSNNKLQQVTAVTGNAQTGASAPTWATAVGHTTTDNNVTWTCRGSYVQGIGVATPAAAPTCNFAPFPATNPAWAANTWYSNPLLITDVGGYIQQLTTPGTTGASLPTFNDTPFTGTTNDGSAVWTCQGLGAWAANTNYSLNALVQVTFSYQVTVYVPTRVWVPLNNGFVNGYWETIPEPQLQTQTVTAYFQCQSPGESGAVAPTWVTGFGSTVIDNGVTWENVGLQMAWSAIGATTKVSNASQVVNTGGFLFSLNNPGQSGSTNPTWNTANVGANTADNTISWSYVGPDSAAGTAPWFYSFAYKSSATGHVGSRSPRSAAITAAQNQMVVVQGPGTPDPFYDTIEVYRTVAGGAVDYWLADIPTAPNWTFNDTILDANLNTFIVASIGANNPPPTGLTNICFYAGRMWGSVGNTVYFASGPDTTIGVPEEAWNALNYFVFPGNVVALYPISGGLLVELQDDLYEILGDSSSTFTAQLSQSKLGIGNPDAVAFDGTNLYIYTSLGQLQQVSSSGNTEVGFNVADELVAFFPPASTSLTVLRSGVNESALYVSSGTGYMMRYSLTTQTWSPVWRVTAGLSKTYAVEISPQTYRMLGSIGTSIVQRDTTVFTDLGVQYPWWFTLGTLSVSSGGAAADISHISVYQRSGGLTPTVGYLPDDISGTFATLTSPVPEPYLLPQGSGLTGLRWYLNSNQSQTSTLMQRLQVQLSFAAGTTSDEIFEIDIIPREEQEA